MKQLYLYVFSLKSYIYQGKNNLPYKTISTIKWCTVKYKDTKIQSQIKIMKLNCCFLIFGLSRLINNLSFISKKNLLVQWIKMLKSSKEGEWSQNKKWSRMEPSSDGLTLFKVDGGNTDTFCKPYFQVSWCHDFLNGKHSRDFFGFWKRC